MIIGYICSKCNYVRINILSHHSNRDINIIIAYACIRNFRSIIIINSRRIVNRYIINIIYNVCIIVRMFIMIISVTTVICITMIQTNFVKSGYIGSNISDINRQILPTCSILKFMSEYYRNSTSNIPLQTV